MTQPPAYSRGFGFANFEASNPTATKPGAEMDAEFDSAAVSINALVANIALIQRDDGLLANLSVHAQALKPDAIAVFNSSLTPRGTWLTATAYAVNDIVLQGTKTYVCLTAHTSGTFATDLAAAKWMVIVDNTSTVTFAAKGAWLTATAYVLGDVVTQGGSTYICSVAHTSGVFATDLAALRWTLLISNVVAVTFAAKGAWLTATAYGLGDIVVQANSVYLCATAHTSGTFATDLAAAKWVLIATNPVFVARSTWLTATAYNFGDVVVNASAYYLCAVSHTSGTFATDLADAKWVLVSPAPTTPPTQSGRFLRRTVYTTPGATTWTRPSDCNLIRVLAIGGGAGGGGASGGGTAGAVGAGGGSGACAEGWILAAQLPAVAANLALTVGALGAGGVGDADGSAGTATTVVNGATTLVSAGGGGGGGRASGSSGVLVAGIANAAAVTVHASVSTTVIGVAGRQGLFGFRRSSTNCESGSGGDPPMGFGAGGRQRAVVAAAGVAAGLAGTGYGAGGSGAAAAGSTSNQTGGPGTAGLIVIDEYS